MFFRKKKVVSEEKQFDEEFIQNFRDFAEYWEERLDSANGKARSITIKSSMVEKLTKILNSIKV